MSRTIEFTVEGNPITWKRPLDADGARSGRARTKPQRAYSRRVAWAALAVRASNWPKAAHFSVTLYVTRQTAAKTDLDNHAKIVLDALNRVAWDDDSQIDELHVHRMPPSKTKPNLRVVVMVLGDTE